MFQEDGRKISKVYQEAAGPLDDRLIKHLSDMIWDEKQPDRQAASYMLGFVEDEIAVDVLLEALASDEDIVRSQSLRSLCLKHDERIVDAALESMEDECWFVRASAAQCLGYHGGMENQLILIEAMSDPEFEVQVEAAAALTRQGDAIAFDILCDFAESNKDQVCRTIARARLKEMP